MTDYQIQEYAKHNLHFYCQYKHTRVSILRLKLNSMTFIPALDGYFVLCHVDCDYVASRETSNRQLPIRRTSIYKVYKQYDAFIHLSRSSYNFCFTEGFSCNFLPIDTSREEKQPCRSNNIIHSRYVNSVLMESSPQM